MSYELGPRRGLYVNIADEIQAGGPPLTTDERARFESFDLIYRSMCALLYNYVPMSGHPGGSISSGRIVAGLLFDTMNYDLADPERPDADILSYAAGHKALGLYALSALRDEIARAGAPDLLPDDPARRLRLEDLLGFRKNPTTATPRFVEFGSKALDGHPTPATPFVKLATGASGVGVSTSVGLGFGARDYYGAEAPRVHIIEGEGGLTPGRVAETLASAGTSRLDNVVVHVDWNQASIDSDGVCRVDRIPGDYVQWDPVELFQLHDWNVIYVPDGKDCQQIVAAQRRALALSTGQPTAIVYCTVKGWRYGIEGRASHGAGHKMCSDGFFEAMAPVLQKYALELPSCGDVAENRCVGSCGDTVMETCLWEALTAVREALAAETDLVENFAGRLRASRAGLDRRARKPRNGAPDVDRVYVAAAEAPLSVPTELALLPGSSTTLRGELGRVLNHYNRLSGGALLAAAADLLGSTSTNVVADGFPAGFWNAHGNIEARLLSTGGICEDAMAGILAGLSSYGRHLGVGASYGAFLAPLAHVPARLHAIGAHARREALGEDALYRPMFLVCAHAGLKTGEDGPTHADPQALQLFQENFPKGTVVSLTPWDPQEIWTLVTASLRQRPAVIAPFVTRPSETILDRGAMGLAPVHAASTGVYCLRPAQGEPDVTVVLQGSEVTYAFLQDALPRLVKDGIDPEVFYVAGAELFDALPADEQERVFPRAAAERAIGITGFTLPTMYRWVTSERGRHATLHPFRDGAFLGSGPGSVVMKQAGLDGEGQYRAVRAFAGKPVGA